MFMGYHQERKVVQDSGKNKDEKVETTKKTKKSYTEVSNGIGNLSSWTINAVFLRE